MTNQPKDEVVRYKAGIENGVAGHFPEPEGKWVKYEDYLALLEQVVVNNTRVVAGRQLRDTWKNRAWTAEEKLEEIKKTKIILPKLSFSATTKGERTEMEYVRRMDIEAIQRAGFEVEVTNDY